MTRNSTTSLAVFATSALAIILCDGYACTGNNASILNVAVTDSPITAAEKIVIAYQGIEIQPEGSTAIAANPDPTAWDTYESAADTCYINMLKLQGEGRRVVFSDNIEPGVLRWTKLLVDALRNEMDSYIEFGDGSQYSLWIPSGTEDGVKLVGGVTVTANGVSDFTVDVDVRKSITRPAADADDHNEYRGPMLTLLYRPQFLDYFRKCSRVL